MQKYNGQRREYWNWRADTFHQFWIGFRQLFWSSLAWKCEVHSNRSLKSMSKDRSEKGVTRFLLRSPFFTMVTFVPYRVRNQRHVESIGFFHVDITLFHWKFWPYPIHNRGKFCNHALPWRKIKRKYWKFAFEKKKIICFKNFFWNFFSL